MRLNSTMKCCPTCKETKPLDDFGVNRARPDGRQRHCRVCQRDRSRANYAKNPERHRAYVADWRVRNPEKVKDYTKRRYHADPERWKTLAKADYWANREKWHARHRLWLDKNREHTLTYQRAYNDKNRERKRLADRARRAAMPVAERRAMWRAQNRTPKSIAYIREYCKRNREQRAAYSREWAQKNQDKRVENNRRRRAKKMASPWIERIDATAIALRDGYRCYLCGKALTRKQITLDHVVPLARGGTHTADNLRVACRSCNCRKGTKFLSELKVTP